MNPMKSLILFCLVSVSVLVNAANANYANYYFTKINGDDGLSQSNVKAIIQDSYGFMWFGTRNRLNRYDGTTMKVFDCYDPDLQRGNNNISSLFEDQNKKLWVGTDKGIYIFDPVSQKFSFFNDSTTDKIQIIDWVEDIQQDLNNNIWIVIPNQGVFRYHLPDKQLIHYSFGNTQIPNQGNAQCICIESNGMVWIGTNGSGVYLYNKNTDSFTQYLGDSKKGDSLKNENIYTMCDYGDVLILGIHEGRLRKLYKRQNTLSDVDAPEVHYKIIRHVICFNGELWVGTQAGLFIINELEHKVVHIQEDRLNPYALSSNVVEKIFRDKENGIWICTGLSGLNYLPNRGFNFEYYVPMSTGNSIGSRRIRELKEDKQGNIWIASEDAGLSIFDPKKKEFKNIGKKEGLSLNTNNVVLGMLLQNDRAWIGLFKNGLDIIQLPRFNIRHYSGEDLNIDEASIYAICEDRYGQVWLGNGWNVYKSDRNQMNFKRIDAFGLNYVYDILEDSNGFIWVATLGNGVFKYNPVNDSIKHYTHISKDSASLSSNSVSNITETSLGEIWFATDRGGICHYNPDTDNFTSFSIQDGFPDDVAYKIIEDKNHLLWFGTNNGLVRFNPATKEVKIFSRNNGLPFKEFNYKSALVTKSGMFYFGGLEGLIAFNPYSFRENQFIPPIYITQINVAHAPLDQSTIHSQTIKLNYNQSNIGFEFVALSYTAPQANQYAYKMEGVDADWIYTNNVHSVSYANLHPGKYIFHVKGSNNDHLWNEGGASVKIEILPPWWQTKMATIMYIALLILLTYYLLTSYNRRTEKKHVEEQKLFEAEKEKELYNSKVEFFTNIAHEIRTPVTLINGPLEVMQEMNIKDPEILKNLNIMRRNTSELLDLVNKLLDFRKVDSNKFPVNISLYNLSEILRTIYERFEPAIAHLNKSITLSLPPEDIFVPVDKEAFTKILNNLLSNALRYSEQIIEVELIRQEEAIFIRVCNDGNLIPEEEREKIFNPFYQVNKHRNSTAGSGIGLSLARSFTEMLNGNLSYAVHDNLNEFTLQLPVKQEEAKKEEVPEADYILPEKEEEQENPHAEIILIVEDNEEMLSFLANQLRKKFVVKKALNGVEALKILEEKTTVDLVLSDIMMPEMDGFELCKNIKNNLEYSHIPVVLVTAKNDLNSKIQGLEMGADAYVEKPFSMNHLITQLTTLLNNRRREKEAFMRKPFLPIQHIGMNKADEQFIHKVIDIIQENITDSDFNVERLSENVFMSRSNLHRKIKALTELSPTDFIRLIRLRKAAELIQSGTYRIGEVCYLVGINSSSYFIKLFQKQFGLTPKEFAKQL